MKLRVLAVGTRMPEWVELAWHDFAKRMPREMPLELIEIKAEPRTTGKPPAILMAAEATRLRTALSGRCHKVMLDERGTDLTTPALAQRLETWLGTGTDIAIIIGGPDGLDADFKKEANETIRLSSLTLPHALVRVILAEALYRAASVLKGHPYHRE